MAESRVLHLNLFLAGDADLGPDEFRSLFEFAEDFSRYILEAEAIALLKELDVPGEWRHATATRIHRLGRKAPVPAEVRSIERGSWNIEIIIPGAALIWILKEFALPVAKEAWNDSRYRKQIKEFLTQRVFGGAATEIEKCASESNRKGRMQVVEIRQEGDVKDQEFGVNVRIERQEVIDIRFNDEELLEEFMRKFAN